MRGALIKALTEIAAQDDRVLFLTGDLGYLAIEPFAERFPDRFVNVGVAEQNMVGIATGLAEAGFVPFVYSIVPFAALRPYEFIRNGPVFHQLPVRIVGIGGGTEYSTNGGSHYGLEDIAVMRALPGLTVLAPADAAQTRTALLATWNLPGPIYYRLGKDDRTIVPGLEGRFELGGVQVLHEGKEILLLASGAISVEAAQAAAQLRARGVACALAIVSTLNPAPSEALRDLLSNFPLAMTVEAHFPSGGLGSLVAEVIAENNLPCRLLRRCINHLPDGITGSQKFMNERFGLTGQQLAQAALKVLGQPAS